MPSAGTRDMARSRKRSGIAPGEKRRAAAYFAVGLPLILGMMVGIGWLITHPAAHDWPFTVEDGLNRTLERNRMPALDDVTGFLSAVADTIGAVTLAVAAMIVARLALHRWR